ncbi:hypothetical protein I1A62_00260 (plasmid) [Rhodococcus sp. USK10]|uniref:hypothetical protein n=1 Tax=Rhodococcus sp. USK10 TaxID=2789739 RepID=UPI001C605021|nr:hypothetical protein [Rhodococcus sp. USK10]QYA99696.1 hypothetical protein I1A62_00260 [Rhodococcus sp. USK10]
MSENEAVVPRSTVEAALYQATKHTWSMSDADLEAIVAGEAAGPLHRTAARGDITFPNPDALRGLL